MEKGSSFFLGRGKRKFVETDRIGAETGGQWKGGEEEMSLPEISDGLLGEGGSPVSGIEEEARRNASLKIAQPRM